MTLKSYFSGTVEAAMELARKELGEDALLVNARPATPETRYLGAYEVVFGLVPRAGATFEPVARQTLSDAVPPRPLAMAAAAGARSSVAPTASQSSASTLFRRELGAFPSTVERPAPSPELASATRPFTQNVARLRLEIAHLSSTARPQLVRPASPLTEQQRRVIPEQIAQESFAPHRLLPGGIRPYLEPSLNTLMETAAPMGGERAQVRSVSEPLDAVISTDPTLGRSGATQAVVALVGPPGAGKTTVLIKLAAQYGLAQRKSVQILTADVHRIAAADQLRSLAAILGVGCEVAQTPQMLARQLEQHRDKDLILIDTPGFGGNESEDSLELAEVLASSDSQDRFIDVHLVLPAFMNLSDMDRAAERYAVFHPAKVLFTRLDETGQIQSLLRFSISSKLPISFLSDGPQMPDDLREADAEWLHQRATGRSSISGPKARLEMQVSAPVVAPPRAMAAGAGR
ncbi:MAG: AAA family ATPase [Acidobacteriota bacterium]